MKKIFFRQKIALVLFGIVGCVILLEIGLRISGGIILLRREHKNNQALKGNGFCRIMCLGGSTTADGGVYSYPAQLEEVLNEKNIGIKFSVINKGLSGCDSTYILSKLKENLDKYKPDIVITMMGANDDIDTVPYQESLKLKIYLFLRGFRVYKLAKLVWLHGAGKIEEIRNHPLDDVEEEQEKDEYIVIREQYTPEISILREKWAIYMDKGKFEQAGAVMKQAIELKPDRPDFYILLLDTYGAQKKYKEAEELIARVLKMFPECQEDVWVLYQLGFFYRRQKKYDKAEEVLKKAIKIQPEYREVYAELATVYREQGKINKLQKICDDIIAQNVESGDVYGFVATSYYEIGMYDEAERYYQKANEFRLKNYKEATRYNYQRLKEIVAQIGIQLVCVQYPVRNVEELKKLFESREGMIFVDNENLFRVALRYGSYEDYFFDNFAGDFGHCTPKGNRLLAESVADRILKEYFSIKN